MNVASVSKFVTAIATVRLLWTSNISLKTPIAGFLPQYWPTGTGVNAISFHDLLRHESGLGGSLNVGGTFSSGPGDFATAKAQIAMGSSGTGAYDYKNVNFAILRVLFATLTGPLPPGFNAGSLSLPEDTFWDFASASAYCNYVNDAVFEAASIAPREFKADDIAAKAYGTPPKAPGWRIEDDVANAGPSGWHLSVGELTRLLSEFRRGGSMMSPWRAEQLVSNFYGLDPPEIATDAGPVYRKGGRVVSPNGETMDSAIYLMPNNVEFAIFVKPGTTADAPSYLDSIAKLIGDSTQFFVPPVGRGLKFRPTREETDRCAHSTITPSDPGADDQQSVRHRSSTTV